MTAVSEGNAALGVYSPSANHPTIWENRKCHLLKGPGYDCISPEHILLCLQCLADEILSCF